MPDALSPSDTEAVLLIEAIGALRIAGRIVQRVADPEGCYRVDGGSPLTSGGVVALAWDTGLMSGPAEIQ
jgi:hypothetical protein